MELHRSQEVYVKFLNDAMMNKGTDCSNLSNGDREETWMVTLPTHATPPIKAIRNNTDFCKEYNLPEKQKEGDSRK